MTSSTFRRFAYALALLLGGCVSPRKYERVDVTLERIELRDAWLDTLVPFALVVCLMLLLVVLYYRRNAPDALDGLFRPRRVPDVVGAVRSWWRNQEELGQFRWLLRLEAHRAHNEESAARRVAKHAATIEAERAEREARRLAEEARRAVPPLGPPRLGFFARFGIGFVAGIIVTAIIILPFVTADAKSGALVLAFGGGIGVIISLIASLVCAALITAVAKKTVWLATICGTAGGAVGGMVIPALLHVATPIVVLAGGAAMGLAIGVADQSSREGIPRDGGRDGE